MKTCHLILKHRYYDAIEEGRQTVEHRKNTPFWRKRILDADRITFHRGYTNTTMTFGIRFTSYDDQEIAIHLGAKL